MNVVLCGMPGCGKSSIARAYSSLYGAKAVDTDKIIVERFGNISDIFAQHGEEYFRIKETEVCCEAAQKYKNAVIALGGGAVLRSQNVQVLRSTGKIFYLKVDEETLIRRLKGDGTRPLVAGDAESRVHALYAERAAIYEACADIVVECSGSPFSIAKKIREYALNF